MHISIDFTQRIDRQTDRQTEETEETDTDTEQKRVSMQSLTN